MSINSEGLFNALTSHALTLGRFDRVNGHESKNAPGNGLTCDIWFARLDPVPPASGLASTSTRVVFTARVYSNMLQEPQDGIDPAILSATDALMAAYSGDFELGGQVRDVDLLGETGIALSAQAGYLKVDTTTYRTVDITIPLVVSDLWTQAP